MAITFNRADKKRLLEAIESINLRAEKQTDGHSSIESFVRIVDYSSLASPNTQVIYGRNGTGKTHLLKSFYEYCEFSFDKTLILPVYIDFKDLDLGNVLTSIPPSDLIYRFYQGFLYKIIERLEEFSKKVITVGFLENMFGTGSAVRKNNINKCIERLKILLNKKQIEEALERYKREVVIDKETASTMGGQFSVTGQVGLKSSAELGASFGISDQKVEKEKETVDLIYRGLAIINYNIIRNELETLIQQCGAKAIIILVDEWSSVDLSVQPVLAEMIKKTLAVSNKIFLKIAALKYFTRTSRADLSRQRVGWQMGIDITPLVDLDSILCYDANEQVVIDFLTLVAYEHTCLAFPVLKKHSNNEFEDYLCSEIFKDLHAYLEVVRASEGNPRDFLNILASCCTNVKFNDTKKISLDQVTRIAASYFATNKSPEIANIPDGEILYQKIFSRAVQNRSKLFLFTKEKAENNQKVQELWHYRVIHLINPNLMAFDENGLPHEYMLYSMDYGKLLSLKVDKMGEILVNGMLITANLLITFSGSLKAPIQFISSTFSKYIDTSRIKGMLKVSLGSFAVSKQGGVESSDTTDLNSLIKKCVLDELLN